jgi:hypothetical protein
MHAQQDQRSLAQPLRRVGAALAEDRILSSLRQLEQVESRFSQNALAAPKQVSPALIVEVPDTCANLPSQITAIFQETTEACSFLIIIVIDNVREDIM